MCEFSVVMPVYARDRADHVRRALASVTTEQTLKPAEVVVVSDGPIGADVEAVITGHELVRLVRLETNQGLTAALNAGLRACRHDIVARQDADDISLPERFERQVPLVAAGYDLVGSDITEFTSTPDEPGERRYMPRTASEIRAALPLRDPFNHPSVVYRAGAVRAVGGYDGPARMEDYWLFARMVAAGCACVNVADSLVAYRVGDGAYARRGGLDLLRTELAMQARLRHLGVTSWPQWLRNCLVRGGYRLVPAQLRRVIYRTIGLRRIFR